MNRTLLFAICTVLGAIVGAVLATFVNELWGTVGVVGLLVIMIALYLGVYLAGGDRA